MEADGKVVAWSLLLTVPDHSFRVCVIVNAYFFGKARRCYIRKHELKGGSVGSYFRFLIKDTKYILFICFRLEGTIINYLVWVIKHTLLFIGDGNCIKVGNILWVVFRPYPDIQFFNKFTGIWDFRHDQSIFGAQKGFVYFQVGSILIGIEKPVNNRDLLVIGIYINISAASVKKHQPCKGEQ